MFRSRVMYVEHKAGGPARIGRVYFSRSGKTLYYRQKAFKSLKGSGICGNYYDTATGEEYWISGPKRDGRNHHWAERGGYTDIDTDVLEEYMRFRKGQGKLGITLAPKPDWIDRLHERENTGLGVRGQGSNVA